MVQDIHSRTASSSHHSKDNTDQNNTVGGEVGSSSDYYNMSSTTTQPQGGGYETNAGPLSDKATKYQFFAASASLPSATSSSSWKQQSQKQLQQQSGDALFKTDPTEPMLARNHSEYNNLVDNQDCNMNVVNNNHNHNDDLNQDNDQPKEDANHGDSANENPDDDGSKKDPDKLVVVWAKSVDEAERKKAEAYENSFKAHCGRLVTNPVFQKTILGLIAMNSLLTALQTFDFIAENPVWQYRLDTLDTILLTVFTVELVLHLYYYGTAVFFGNAWLVFDFVVVTTSWLFSTLTVFRSFRIVRTIRFVTHLRDIQQLVEALGNVIPRMFAIFTFLLLIYFVFAVVMTELFQHTYEQGITSEDHFSRLDITAFTLLQFMFMDDWSGVTKELMAVYPWAWLPILSFIIICTFVVVNLIIAVICDAVQAIQTDEMATQITAMQKVTTNAISKAHNNDQLERERLENKLDEILALLQQTVQQQQQLQQQQTNNNNQKSTNNNNIQTTQSQPQQQRQISSTTSPVFRHDTKSM